MRSRVSVLRHDLKSRRAGIVFCYHQMMHLNLHRFLAYVLLLLLPLQAVAAGAVIACPVANARQIPTDLVMEECDDAAMMQTNTKTTFKQDNNTSAEHESHDRIVPCAMSSSCQALVTIAVLPEMSPWLIDSAFSPIGFAEDFYRSFIPEGLQRPPQVG